MKRFMTIGLIAIAVSGFPGLARGAETVLILSSSEPEYGVVADAFRSAFSCDFREINLEGSDERQRTVGEELKASKPAVAVVVGDLAAQMAKWYLEGVPVIYCDAVRATKMSLASSSVGIYHEPDPGKQLRIMHELFPEKTRIGLLYSPEYASINEADVKRESKSLGITLELSGMRSIKQVPSKLREIIPKVDLLWVLTDPVVLSSHSSQYLVLQSISGGIPIFCGDKLLAHGGATAALVPDLEDAGKKAAENAKQVLTGSGPSPGTVIYPKGKLVLNQRTASLLKVSFPPSLVSQAGEVIQ